MRSPLPSVRCLDSNSRLALRYRFGPHNKDTMSLGCVALVHPTLLTFIKYCSNTYIDIQVPHIRDIPTGDVSPLEVVPNRRCQVRPMARLYEYCLSRKTSLA